MKMKKIITFAMMLFIIGGCKMKKIQIQIMLMQQLIKQGAP